MISLHNRDWSLPMLENSNSLKWVKSKKAKSHDTPNATKATVSEEKAQSDMEIVTVDGAGQTPIDSLKGESGEKRQRVYHNIVLQKAIALKFAEVNAPVEVECQIVGLGDRNLVGDKIKTEQVKDHPQQKWYSCYQEEVVVGEGNRVTLRLRNSTTRDTTRYLRPGDIVAKTLL